MPTRRASRTASEDLALLPTVSNRPTPVIKAPADVELSDDLWVYGMAVIKAGLHTGSIFRLVLGRRHGRHVNSR